MAAGYTSNVATAQITNKIPESLPMIAPAGTSFSINTTTVSTAIHTRFITPPTNSSAMSIQQQPTQYAP